MAAPEKVYRSGAQRSWEKGLELLGVAVTHSPAEITAAWPTKVTSSRWPRALTRRTQKPFSAF
jgi:hypothetical protein